MSVPPNPTIEGHLLLVTRLFMRFDKTVVIDPVTMFPDIIFWLIPAPPADPISILVVIILEVSTFLDDSPVLLESIFILFDLLLDIVDSVPTDVAVIFPVAKLSVTEEFTKLPCTIIEPCVTKLLCNRGAES